MKIYLPASFVLAGWQHRRLVARLAWRKIEARYRGSVIGLPWALIHPLLMLCVYTFVFSVVFRVRWQVDHGGNAEFALILFSGLILYSIFADCVNEAPRLMLSHRTYIKQLLFPVEILVWVNVVSALFHFVLSLVLLLGFYLVVHGTPPVTWLYLPLVMLPILLITLGASWFLSSLGVFLRDISQVIGVVTTALLFLSPIFYPASRIPEAFRPYYFLNPFATLLEMSKGLLFDGAAPDLVHLALLAGGTWLFTWLGYVWFMATKRGFADVV